MIEKIISMIEEEIAKIDSQINETKKQTLNPLLELKELLKQVIDNPLNVSTVNVTEINSELKCLNDETLRRITLYQKLSRSVNFPLVENQKNDIRRIFSTIDESLDEKIRISEKAINVEELAEKKEKYSKLKAKLISNDAINGKDLDLIVEFLKASNTNIKQAMDIVIELTLSSIDKLSKVDYEEEEIIELIETNLDIDEVTQLFRKYGLDFDDFESKEQQKIIKFGNIERMTAILETLRNNHIYINLSEKSHQIQEILVHSSNEIVNKIINNILIDAAQNNATINLDAIMQLYINNPSIFIRGNRSYQRREEPLPGGGGGQPADVIGAFDNYQENRQTFIELGIDMVKASTQTIAALSFSSRKIKENIANYDFYGIPRDKYAKTITCLKASDPLSTMDIFIELGYQDYILNNLSRLTKRYDDLMFYRIVKAFQNGQSHDDLYFNKDKPLMLGDITNASSKMFGITEENKEKEVGQYKPKFLAKYNEIVYNAKNNGPLSLVLEDKLIKKLEVYKEDELKYNFNGIIISRLKVLRIYETLLKNLLGGTVNSIKYSIYKYSILTKEQYQMIEACLDRVYNETKGVGIK